MYSIVMDTSNQYLVVALYQDDTLLGATQQLGSQRQSENAIPCLKELLDKSSLSLLDIDEVVITRGPGSYTGVRVAMTIAKTLSVLKPISLKAISSLKAYAGLNKAVSVLDARSHKIFVCAYENGKALCDESLIDIDDFESFQKQYLDFEVVGQTSLLSIEEKEVSLYENLHNLSKEEESVESIDSLTPIYLKDVEAKKVCL